MELLTVSPIVTHESPSTNGFTVGLAVGVGVGVGVTVGVDVGFGATATPLFQTNFFPLLMQEYFLPFAVAVVPTFLQVSPAFTAATAFNCTRKSAAVTRIARSFFTKKG